MIDDVIQAFAQTFSPPLRRSCSSGRTRGAAAACPRRGSPNIHHAVSSRRPLSKWPCHRNRARPDRRRDLPHGTDQLVIAALFVDEVAEEVERTSFQADPVGRGAPIAQSLLLSVKFFGSF